MHVNVSIGSRPRPSLGERFALPRPRLFPPRLLVVEDDRELWPVLARVAWLANSDLQVDFTADTEAAVAKLEGDIRYDAVLADYLLDDHTGLWVKQSVASRQPWARVGIMSSFPVENAVGGECAFLPKPFSIRDCRSFLSELITR